MAFTKINAAGIGTTETVTVDGLTVINDGSFGGNLTVSGVLTYEDVTNVDSVGLITARNGIVVGSGITLSKDGDIFATGITTVSGNVKVGTGITLSPDGDGFFTGVITATSYSGIDLSDVTGATGDFSIADKIVHTGDTDTAIRFPSSNQISFETTGSEGVRIDGGGRLLVGTTAARTFGGSVYAHLQLEGTTQQGSQFTITRNTNDTYAPNISLVKTRGTSDGAVTTVQDNDTLGTIQFRGADGSDVFAVAATIAGEVDGSPSDGADMPGALTFATTADGAASPTERARITSAGLFGIGTNSPDARLYVNGVSTANLITARTADSNGSAIINILSEGTTGNSRINFSDTAGIDGQISYSHNDRALIFATAGTTERLRINSSGAVSIGNNPTVNSDTLFHVEKAGETNVVFEGDTSTLGARLTLKNNNTGASAVNQIDFADAGGQSTSSIKGYNTDQSNNYGYLTFNTRSASGTPPEERMRISKEGYVTKPNNPAFMARTSSGNFQIAYGGTHILYSVEIYDAGGNYDTSNGRFTAPVNGYYYLQHQLSMHNGNAGTLEPKVYIDGAERFRHYTKVESGGGAVSGSAHGIIYLVAGQYAQAYAHWSSGNLNNAVAQAQNNLPISFFTGYLVS